MLLFLIDLIISFQILQLEQANVRVPEQLNNARFPPKIYSILESWQPLTWKEYSQTKQTNILLQEGLISEEDIFYRAVITRGSGEFFFNLPSYATGNK